MLILKASALQMRMDRFENIACVFGQTPSPVLSLTLRSALLLYNKMLNRCAIEFFVKHIQCSFLLFYIHFEARQFGTLGS